MLSVIISSLLLYGIFLPVQSSNPVWGLPRTGLPLAIPPACSIQTSPGGGVCCFLSSSLPLTQARCISLYPPLVITTPLSQNGCFFLFPTPHHLAHALKNLPLNSPSLRYKWGWIFGMVKGKWIRNREMFGRIQNDVLGILITSQSQPHLSIYIRLPHVDTPCC